MRTRFLLLLLAALPLAACGDPTSSRVAFGDSVTFGWGGKAGGWVSILSNERHEPIANYGVPTELVRDGRRRFGSPVGPLALSPYLDEILLLHGGNDLAARFLKSPCDGRCHPADLDSASDEIVADVEAIVDEARDNGKNVVLGTYWRVNMDACAKAMHLDADQVVLANELIDDYDRKLVAMAYRKRLPVVRLDSLNLEREESNFYDCIHPSDAGYRQVADAWRTALSD